ncbi:hypothetical protein TNMX_07420 [Thermus sp. NMX2.A1]|nr:hypothetical protein TNMX_07420 [Thermus sp. NMX2.A1]
MAQRYRFGIEEFERLFQGVTGVELLDGEAYPVIPTGPGRAWALACLVNVLICFYAHHPGPP